MRCGNRSCEREATNYWEAVVAQPDETVGTDGYACDEHAPRWQDLGHPSVLQFRLVAMANSQWAGEVLDEHNPLGYSWAGGEL